MFESYYGLTEKPFSLTPDTDFFYHSFTHQEALNVLLVALSDGDGFIKVTGEVGTGKTLLCRKLLESLNDGYQSVFIPNPYMDTNELLNAIALEMGLQPKLGEQVINIINQHVLDNASQGIKTVLLLDEAQSLPEASLEAIRLLSNLETEKQKLIQIILFGQPELNQTLENSSIRQLQQRIMHAYELTPLNEQALEHYLQCRLQKAGYRGANLFSPKALSLLFEKSKGIPRLINILASKSLLSAYGKGDFYIKPSHVRAAIADSDFVKTNTTKVTEPLLWWLLSAATVLALWFRLPQ